jgi:hypothetical protein
LAGLVFFQLADGLTSIARRNASRGDKEHLGVDCGLISLLSYMTVKFIHQLNGLSKVPVEKKLPIERDHDGKQRL